MWKTLAFVTFASLVVSSAAPQVEDQADAAKSGAALTELLARPGCGPQLVPELTYVADRLPRVSGMGNASLPGASSKPDAQAWFEYGLTLAHAFQHEDALRAFQESQRLDPSCALCVWGEAWGLGPTINYGVDSKKRAAAAALLQKASILAADAPETTKALIAATQKRSKTSDARTQDVAFAEAMDAIAKSQPDDVEIAVLAADAWLIANFSHGDQRGYPRALKLLEGALARKPNDAGALHFYIHAAEMSGDAGKAMAAAKRLPSTAPSASHLIHMPGHVYYNVGEYDQATRANLDAIRVAAFYAKAIEAKGPLGTSGYYGHNLHYGMAAALVAGDAKSALLFAGEFAKAYPGFQDLSPWQQMVAAQYYASMGRFADKATVLALPEPKTALLRAMRAYARGEALVRSGDVKAARIEAARIAISVADLKTFADNSSIAQGIVDVARNTLDGRIAMASRSWSAAIDSYGKAAIAEEDKLRNHKDPAWWFGSPRRYLAAAYIKSGKPALAKQEAQKALEAWPQDPAALFVLGVAQSALGDAKQSAISLKAARAGWAGDPALLRLDGI